MALATTPTLYAPLALGYLVSAACPMDGSQGAELPQRPPAFVFGIVWPILYLCTGYAWVSVRRRASWHNALMYLLVFLLTLWPLTFSCLGYEKAAIFVLALIIATTVGVMALHESRSAVVALVPLLAWCLVAFLLNWGVVELRDPFCHGIECI